MKRPNDALYFVTPQAEGWAVWCGEQRLHIASTLAEALDLVPPASPFEFAVPCYPLIIERLRLPATAPEELAGMVQLQWEKALPFPPEEMTGSFAVVDTADGETTVWSVVAAQEAWREFGDIWSKANRWPRRVTPHVCQVAAACPAGETVLVVHAEQGHWVVTVVENRRPGWTHVMSASEAPGFAAEFPSLMLTLGLDGAPISFARVILAPEIIGCEVTLRAAGSAPTEVLPLVTPGAEVEIDFLPTEWQASAHQHRAGRAWRKRGVLAGAAYLFFVLLGMFHLLALQHQASRLEAELNAQRPALALLQSRRARFTALAPAIDSRRYAIELLYLLNRCLPGESIHFTEFEQMPQQWRVVGEATTARIATDYLARLKRDPDLSGSEISAEPPRLLANERAQFQVIGKP